MIFRIYRKINLANFLDQWFDIILQCQFEPDAKSSSQPAARQTEEGAEPAAMEIQGEEEIDLDIAKLVQKKQETDPSFSWGIWRANQDTYMGFCRPGALLHNTSGITEFHMFGRN